MIYNITNEPRLKNVHWYRTLEVLHITTKKPPAPFPASTIICSPSNGISKAKEKKT